MLEFKEKVEQAVVVSTGRKLFVPYKDEKGKQQQCDVESLSYDELTRTVKATNENGRPKSMPKEHYEILSDVNNLCLANGLNPVYDTIYSAGGKFAKYIEQLGPYVGERTLGSYYLQKLSGKILLNDLSTDDNEAMLGFTFNERGVMVCYGTNIRVCQNMTVFGMQNVVRTYDNDKVPYEKMLEVINSWMSKFKDKRQYDLEMIKKLQDTKVTQRDILQIIGKLNCLAVEQAYIDSQVVAPLNISQVSGFTREYLTKLANQEVIGTMWDVLNLGTARLHFNNMDMSNTIECSAKFSELCLSL